MAVMAPKPRAALAVAFAIAALAAGGCGGAEGEGGKHPDYSGLADAPAPLASVYHQGNELLGGGKDAYEKRIASLRGYPVVVNFWASWCGPCRFEFPMFQQLSTRYGKRVAFLGVNGEDSDDAAETFLGEDPVPYPSYTDPHRDIIESVGARYFPDTAFYGRDGRLCSLKLGQYASQSDLNADIRRFALGEECEGG